MGIVSESKTENSDQIPSAKMVNETSALLINFTRGDVVLTGYYYLPRPRRGSVFLRFADVARKIASLPAQRDAMANVRNTVGINLIRGNRMGGRMRERGESSSRGSHASNARCRLPDDRARMEIEFRRVFHRYDDSICPATS